jgi:hypothetical protein
MLFDQHMGGWTPRKASIRAHTVDYGVIQLRHHELAGHSTLRAGKKCRPMRQKISGPGPWGHPVDGQAHTDRCGTHFQDYRFPTVGAQPEEFLENKVREKEMAEQVKAQFDTSRGSRGLIIKEINDDVMRFTNKLIVCKLLRKCRREESPAGVIAVATQCAKGMMFNWAQYLLNQFLLDCRDAQDNGTEFHYSWLMILVALAGWQEPKYTAFITRMGKCYAARYESLWQAKDNKAQQENNAVFSMLLEEIQQCTANTWHIPREVA